MRTDVSNNIIAMSYAQSINNILKILPITHQNMTYTQQLYYYADVLIFLIDENDVKRNVEKYIDYLHLDHIDPNDYHLQKRRKLLASKDFWAVIEQYANTWTHSYN